MKHDWSFINRLESFAIVERLVSFYVDQYNRVIPHSALKGRTPDEVFRGEANDLPERLRKAHQTAIRDRVAVNERLSCESCQIASSTDLGSSEIAVPERKVE